MSSFVSCLVPMRVSGLLYLSYIFLPICLVSCFFVNFLQSYHILAILATILIVFLCLVVMRVLDCYILDKCFGLICHVSCLACCFIVSISSWLTNGGAMSSQPFFFRSCLYMPYCHALTFFVPTSPKKELNKEKQKEQSRRVGQRPLQCRLHVGWGNVLPFLLLLILSLHDLLS